MNTSLYTCWSSAKAIKIYIDKFNFYPRHCNFDWLFLASLRWLLSYRIVVCISIVAACCWHLHCTTIHLMACLCSLVCWQDGLRSVACCRAVTATNGAEPPPLSVPFGRGPIYLCIDSDATKWSIWVLRCLSAGDRTLVCLVYIWTCCRQTFCFCSTTWAGTNERWRLVRSAAISTWSAKR